MPDPNDEINELMHFMDSESSIHMDFMHKHKNFLATCISLQQHVRAFMLRNRQYRLQQLGLVFNQASSQMDNRHVGDTLFNFVRAVVDSSKVAHMTELQRVILDLLNRKQGKVTSAQLHALSTAITGEAGKQVIKITFECC